MTYEKFDYVVYIGRFQPPTLAHQAMFKKALDQGKKLIIVIGSDKASPSLRNPFTTEERRKMILWSIEDLGYDDNRVVCIPMQDSAYNFTAWVSELQRKVHAIIPEGSSVALLGHYKDNTSYYLKHFPEWNSITSSSLHDGLSATEVRVSLFSGNGLHSLKGKVPESVFDFLTDYTIHHPYRFDNLKSEYKFIEKYKDDWKDAPYAPTFVTTDAVVFCNGHILLIKRGRNPGKGQYALPGGFLDQKEVVEEGCIRELIEETKINTPIPILKSSIKEVKYIDNPWRDPRGRTITFAHLIELGLKELPKVKAADDAAEVEWLPIGSLSNLEGQFFNDHLQIIKYFLGRSM